MDHLPNEILVQIFENITLMELGFCYLVKLERVCSSWKEIIRTYKWYIHHASFYFINPQIENIIMHYHFKNYDFSHTHITLTNDILNRLSHYDEIHFRDYPLYIVTDKVLDAIRNVPNLHLIHCDKITSQGASYLGSQKELIIYTEKPIITDEHLVLFSGIEDLGITSLFYNYFVTDIGIQKLTHVKKLSMNFSNVTDEGIKHLVNLEDLEIFSSRIKGYGLTLLPKLKRLYSSGSILDEYKSILREKGVSVRIGTSY